MGAVNGDGRLPGSQFGIATDAWYSTGAGGSPSNPDTSVGEVVGTPVISAPFGSSQLPANMGRLPVTAGDTCSLSSDSPVPVTGDPMTGLSLSQVTQTGAGQGHAGGVGNPTAVGVPSLVAQAEAARRPS